MSTAKPQSNANKSDDLIAELAKLMAQDAKADGSIPEVSVDLAEPEVVAPSVTATPASGNATAPHPTVRIPGMDYVPSRPTPVDAPVALEKVEPTVAPVSQPAPQVSARSGRPDSDFDFDFGFNSPTPKPAAPAPKPVATTSVLPSSTPVASAKEPTPAPVAVVEKAEVPAHSVSPVDVEASVDEQDVIADLIAAELASSESKPELAPKPPVSQVVTPFVRPNLTPAETPRASVATPTPIKPASEPDTFKVSPVFGLGGQPQTPAPATPRISVVSETVHPEPRKPSEPATLDPIDEIESLIGEAVRVELSAKGPSSPVVKAPINRAAIPMPSQSQPRAEKIEPSSAPQVNSADEAILAAAASTGATIDSVDEDFPAVDNRRRQKKAKRVREARQVDDEARVPRRWYTGPLVAGALLLVAGFGLYWVLGLGGDAPEAPVLTADSAPVKEQPAAPETTAEAPRSVVMDEIDGVDSTADGENIVSRDQTAEADFAATPPETVDDSALANRKVRTVTVRPDGTIISGDDAIAGTEALPVDRPEVPAIAETATNPAADALLQGAEAEAAASTAALQPVDPTTISPDASALTSNPVTAVVTPDPTTATTTTETPATELAAVDPSATATTTATTPAATNLVSDAPAPMPRPAWLDSRPASAPVSAVASTEPLAATPEPTTTTTAAAPTTDAVAWVQLTSQRSEAEAQSLAQRFQQSYGSLFGGAQLQVQRADLGDMGVYYRVRLPASSRAEANQICAQVKGAGGDCFTN